MSSDLYDILSHCVQLRCCGVLNYTSWFSSVYFPENGIPPSCCANISDCNSSDLRNATIVVTKVHQQVTHTNTLIVFFMYLQCFRCVQGCYELVTTFIETNMGIIAGVTFGIAFSQVRRKRILFLSFIFLCLQEISIFLSFFFTLFIFYTFKKKIVNTFYFKHILFGLYFKH